MTAPGRPLTNAPVATATVDAVCIGAGRTVAKTAVPLATMGPFGFDGDRHAGETFVPRYGHNRGQRVFNERQWSAVSAEEVAELEGRLGTTIPVGALGENLRLSGVAGLSDLPSGTRLTFPSGAVLFVSGQNAPCARAAASLAALSGVAAIRRLFTKAATGRRGLVGWVETPGLVRAGDEVRVTFEGP